MYKDIKNSPKKCRQKILKRMCKTSLKQLAITVFKYIGL